MLADLQRCAIEETGGYCCPSPATPMKKGNILPKLALAFAGEAGVPKDVLDTSVRWTDGSVLILSPINLFTSEAARRSNMGAAWYSDG